MLADDDWAWMMRFVGDKQAALRSRLFAGQVAVELAAACGQPARAIEALELTVDHGLFDIVWMGGCPLVTPLAADARFAALRRRTADRAAQVSSAYRASDLA